MVARLHQQCREERRRTRPGSRVRSRVESQDPFGEKASRPRRKDHEASLPHLHQDREVLEAWPLLPLQEGRKVEQAAKAEQEVTRQS